MIRMLTHYPPHFFSTLVSAENFLLKPILTNSTKYQAPIYLPHVRDCKVSSKVTESYSMSF